MRLLLRLARGAAAAPRRTVKAIVGVPGWIAGAVRQFWRLPPGRRLLAAGGAASLVAGVVLLSVGLVSYLEDDGDGAAPAAAIGPQDPQWLAGPPLDEKPVRATPSPQPSAQPTPAVVPLAEEDYRMVIEAIGVDAPVRTYGLDENAVPVVPTGSDAAEVVAWYNFSARPGMGSNAVFAGHVTWYGVAVFYRLKELQPGDTIKLVGRDGTELQYAVTETKAVKPEDPEALRVMWGTDEDVITLITCDGSFVDTGDPVFGGEYTDRRVVRAELRSVSVAEEAGTATGG